MIPKTAAPAKAGAHRANNELVEEWVPAFAGTAALEGHSK